MVLIVTIVTCTAVLAEVLWRLAVPRLFQAYVLTFVVEGIAAFAVILLTRMRAEAGSVAPADAVSLTLAAIVMLVYVIATVSTAGVTIWFYNSLVIAPAVSIALAAIGLAWLWHRLVQSVLRKGLRSASDLLPLVGSSVVIAVIPYAALSGGGPQ